MLQRPAMGAANEVEDELLILPDEGFKILAHESLLHWPETC